MKLYNSNYYQFYPAGKMGKKGNFESDVNLLVSACNASNVTGKSSNSSVKAQANSVVSKISTINFSPFLFLQITTLMSCNSTIKSKCAPPNTTVDKDKMTACNTTVYKYMASSAACQVKNARVEKRTSLTYLLCERVYRPIL